MTDPPRELGRGRQRVPVVQAQRHHQAAKQQEHDGPGGSDAKAFFEFARQDQEATEREELGGVEESALPARIRRLLARRQAADIDAVGDDVVRARGQRHDCQQRQAHRKPHRQLQGQRDQRQAGAAEDLAGDDGHAPARGQFQERTPQRLEGPGQAEQARPAGDLVVRHAHALEHLAGDQRHRIERQALRQVQRGHPRQRMAPWRMVDRGSDQRLVHGDSRCRVTMRLTRPCVSMLASFTMRTPRTGTGSA